MSLFRCLPRYLEPTAQKRSLRQTGGGFQCLLRDNRSYFDCPGGGPPGVPPISRLLLKFAGGLFASGGIVTTGFLPSLKVASSAAVAPDSEPQPTAATRATAERARNAFLRIESNLNINLGCSSTCSGCRGLADTAQLGSSPPDSSSWRGRR